MNQEREEHRRLHDWELQTIEQLAAEHLTTLQQTDFVRHPDRFVDKYIADLQRDCLDPDQPKIRRSLEQQANRLGIGMQPPHVSTLPPLPTPDDTLASRWCRITLLKLRTPDDHPWSQLFHELVTTPVQIHRHTTHPWAPADAGIGILELLEDEARAHNLIAGDAPELAAKDATHQMLMGAGT